MTPARSVRRRGYVLLVTLGLLVLSTTLLVAVARSAVRRVTLARFEQDRVQRRWATESARQAVLPYAEQVLVTAEQNERRAAASVRADVRLGETTVTLVVADEQAKANVNDLLGREPVDAVEDRLRRALSGTPAFAHVRLRPAPADLAAAAVPVETRLPPVSGFGQVLDDLSPTVLWPAAGASALDGLTVWGDGGLNVMRAGRTEMRAALTPTLSGVQLDRLIAVRDAAFGGSKVTLPAGRAGDAVGMLLDRAGIPPAARAKLPLTAHSACHALHVCVRTARRAWYDTSVLDETDARRPRSYVVAW